VAPASVAATLAAAKAAGHEAWVAGHVKKAGGRKAVTIPSLGLAYEADTLQVR
jgi:phosphoribosylformylglycinamidine cyclo-ligase